MIKLPPIFRMLIVDDRVGREPDKAEQIRNVVEYWALEAAEGRDIRVELCVESDSVRGFERWCNEVFDLTLIDSDFSRNYSDKLAGKPGDTLISRIVNTEHQGFELLRLILDRQDPTNGKYEEPFDYRAGANKVFLWSGLGDQVLKARFTEFGWGEPTTCSFFRAKKDLQKTLQDEVAKGVGRALDPGQLSAAQALERLVYSLARGEQFTGADLPTGGFLIWADANAATNALPCGGGKFGLLGAIPEKQGEQEGKDTESSPPWLPLHGALVDHYGLANVVQYYLRGNETNGSNVFKTIADDCTHLRKRTEDLSSSRSKPVYPTPNATCRRSSAIEQKTQVLGHAFKNPWFAAATPLTGTTVVGEERAIEAMVEKAKALLNGPFGAIVLKTVYLDSASQWDGVFWPGLQIQSHMRTRCLYPPSGTHTIWNTGRTAMEMFPPKVLGKFLEQFAKAVSEADNKIDLHRVIVSLGSKFCLPTEWMRVNVTEARNLWRGIWFRLFEEVFGTPQSESVRDDYPLVEINARHTLRELVERQGEGDEYLSPLSVSGDTFDPQDPVLVDFLVWLQIVHDVAVSFRKRLIIKLPHRSDIFAYVKSVAWVRRVHLESAPDDTRDCGVRAISLINTVKTPVWPVNAPREYHSSWYADPIAWNDAANKLAKYQMAGGLLSAYRGQILAPLIEKKEGLGDLEVLVGGGITDHAMLQRSRDDAGQLADPSGSKQRKTSGAVQIGTWALLNMDLTKASWEEEPSLSTDRPERLQDFELDGCLGCTCAIASSTEFLEWVEFEGKKSPRLRDGCQMTVTAVRTRLRDCRVGSIHLKPRQHNKNGCDTPVRSDNTIQPRFAWLDPTRCKACGRCSASFYCDAFLDRKYTRLIPEMQPRYCTGCGLCAQLCPHGALHLYRPEEYVVLVSDLGEDLGEDHRRLSAMGIPHMTIHPIDDLCHLVHDQGILESIIKTMSAPDDAETDVTELLEVICASRLREVNALGRGAERDYPDKRGENLDQAMSALTKLHSDADSTRVKIWSMLIWSDPEQVLWDTLVAFRRNDGKWTCTRRGEVACAGVEDLVTHDCLKQARHARDERRAAGDSR